MAQPVEHFAQSFRDTLITRPDGRVLRKTARIVAVQVMVPFTVETDRGLMTGESGDWLVTNHPDDDACSDLWSISAARMQSTYAPAVAESIEDLIKRAHAMLEKATGRDLDKPHSLDQTQFFVECALDELRAWTIRQGVL